MFNTIFLCWSGFNFLAWATVSTSTHGGSMPAACFGARLIGFVANVAGGTLPLQETSGEKSIAQGTLLLMLSTCLEVNYNKEY